MRKKTSGQKRLRAGIPRVFHDHRSPRARAFRREYLAITRRFPGLPSTASVWIREAALLAVELATLAQDADIARARGQVRKPQHLASRAARARHQLMAIEDRLAAMVPAPKPKTIAEVFFSGDANK